MWPHLLNGDRHLLDADAEALAAERRLALSLVLLRGNVEIEVGKWMGPGRSFAPSSFPFLPCKGI